MVTFILHTKSWQESAELHAEEEKRRQLRLERKLAVIEQAQMREAAARDAPKVCAHTFNPV